MGCCIPSISQRPVFIIALLLFEHAHCAQTIRRSVPRNAPSITLPAKYGVTAFPGAVVGILSEAVIPVKRINVQCEADCGEMTNDRRSRSLLS